MPRVVSGSSAPFTRREFGRVTAAAFVTAVAAGCRLDGAASDQDGRLTVRPNARAKTTASGEHKLGLGGERDAILQVPSKPAGEAMPLLVLLHGAGSSGQRQLGRMGTSAQDAGVAVLAPDSRGLTWDAIRGGYGPDIAFLNRALEKVFSMVSVDPARLTMGGFSDGATYALSIGLINGDLFPRVVAFSPGFIVDGPAHGRPKVFISHGRADEILPIDRASRRLVPALKQRGYDVTFQEFDGGHEVPPAIAAQAMSWIAAM